MVRFVHMGHYDGFLRSTYLEYAYSTDWYFSPLQLSMKMCSNLAVLLWIHRIFAFDSHFWTSYEVGTLIEHKKQDPPYEKVIETELIRIMHVFSLKTVFFFFVKVHTAHRAKPKQWKGFEKAWGKVSLKDWPFGEVGLYVVFTHFM